MKFDNIIGSDETGVGDYFTPLIAVAAYIPKNNLDKVKKLGIKDSKKISDKKIISLYFELKDLVIWKKMVLSQKGYNQLNKSFNAHELKTLIHTNVISNLEKEVKNDLVIVDKFADEKNWNKYIKKINNSSLKVQNIRSKIIFEEKAEDKYLQVAAASIIARAILIFEMKKQNQKWDFIFPLGSSNKIIEVGKKFVSKYSEEELVSVAKINFKTTTKILN